MLHDTIDARRDHAAVRIEHRCAEGATGVEFDVALRQPDREADLVLVADEACGRIGFVAHPGGSVR